ncbi:MAG: hypothetical protein GY851_27945 [bacterium]|nr:hypothetical protein [bacterium]
MKSRLLKVAVVCLVAMGFAVGSVWLTFVGCTRTVQIDVPVVADDHTPGALHQVEQIGSYTASMFRFLIWWGELPEPVSVRNGVWLYRVQYWTTTPNGEATLASGLVCVPKARTLRGAISYQHGTATNRHLAPSAPTLLESGLGSALFAGGGYILCAADYVGLGINREVHPYLHAQGTANAVIDLLKATDTFAEHLERKWPSSLYLVGFSQGGYSTMAAHRALESLDDPRFQVVACAPIAGVFDLAGVTFPDFLERTSAYHAAYLAYLVNAYASAYDQPLNSVLTDSYAELVPTLFDGEHDEWVVAQSMPKEPRALFRKEFLEAYDNQQPHWLMTALVENGVFKWTPKAPVRIYFGERDQTVSPTEGKAAVDEFTKRGCDASLVSIGQYDHGGTVLHAAPKIRNWFDEIADKSGG